MLNASSAVGKDTMIRRKDFSGDQEATGFVCEMRLRRVRRWSGRKISRSLRLVIISVFVGGEGDGIGGIVDRSIERLERDERVDDDRDVGDGVRFMLLFVLVLKAELPVLTVGSCSMVGVVGGRVNEREMGTVTNSCFFDCAAG